MNKRLLLKGLPYRVVKSGTVVYDPVSDVAHVVGNDSIIVGPTEIVLGSNAVERMRKLIEGDEHGDT